MAYHIPFAHRRRQPPIYIGFDEPRVRPLRRRRRFNGWGLTGFLLSLLSFATLCLLSPLALLVSLFGLRRRPRGLAMAGTFFGLIGTGLLALAITVAATAHNRHQHAAAMSQRNHALAIERKETRGTLADAVEIVEAYVANHGGLLPAAYDGNLLVVPLTDAWGNELRYELDRQFATVRSAGPDHKFESRDDLVERVIGAVPVESPLLPL